MSSPHYFSPLRYPGGKGKLTDYVKEIVYLNQIQDGCYVEPYAGGAAVAMELLIMGHVSTIFINDFNRSVHSFWNSVLNQTEELCDRIQSIPVNMDTWHQQKAIQTDSSSASTLDLGFSTFFLNRCNRSGIISGGVIGGKDQAGKWKLDARYNRKELIRRIKLIAQYKSQINLSQQDAALFLKEWQINPTEKTLIYLDPPYFRKSKRLYDSLYSHSDHTEIAQLVENLKGVRWVVSYDDEPEIRDLYKRLRNITYSLSYSVRDRYKGREVMFFSHDLNIPEIPVKGPVRLIAS